MGGDFRLPEADVPARDEDIDSRVDVPVMPSTTSVANPLSYYEAFSTLWAAACTAHGTDLRGKSLVHLDVLGCVPCGFVAQLRSKRRPAGIEHGLGQAGSGKPTAIDVADAHAPALAHEPRGELMQEMFATVGDLGVDSPDTGLSPSPLGGGKRQLVFAVDAWGLKRNPPQGFSAPPSRPLSAGIARDRKLLADRLHGIRVQAEEFAGAAGELDQVKARRPALVVPPSGVLDLPAIVPDPIHVPSLSPKMPTGGGILDPVPVREHHGDKVLGPFEINNPDAEFSCAFTRLTSRPQHRR